MSAKHDLIQKRLRDEGVKLIALFESLTPDQWAMTIYTDGMVWTIKDLLAHQVSVERIFQFYGRDILNGGEGAPEDFAINNFNNAEVASMADRPVADLMIDLRAARQATIDLVSTIVEDDFNKRGRHPFFGMMSIDEMFKLIYRHNMLHARDIRRAIPPKDGDSIGGSDHDPE